MIFFNGGWMKRITGCFSGRDLDLAFNGTYNVNVNKDLLQSISGIVPYKQSLKLLYLCT